MGRRDKSAMRRNIACFAGRRRFDAGFWCATALMDKNAFSAVLLSALASLLFMACNRPPDEKSAAPVVNSVRVKDSAKRTVELKGPATRAVVVYSQVLLAMKAIGVEDDRIVGVDEFTHNQYRYVLAGVTNKPTVGANLFNLDIEKIIALDPQVLIVTPIALRRMSDMEAQLEKNGIKTVCLDFNIKNVKDVLATLGAIFGKQAEAEDFSAFWFSKLDHINAALARHADRDKVKVYWENTNAPFNTINKTSHAHELLTLAGGYNIARDLAGIKADPEWIVTQNPDVIIKYPMGSPHQGGFGQNDIKPFHAMREEILHRPGFGQITAVRKKRVYIVSQLIKTGLFENVAICCLAKVLYPDLFKDLDPMGHLKEMVERYLRLDFNSMRGTLVYPEP